MSITETIGFGWVILSTTLFTVACAIALIYTLTIGLKKVLGWLRAGQKAEEQIARWDPEALFNKERQRKEK